MCERGRAWECVGSAWACVHVCRFVRACVCVYVRVCARACARVCVRARVCARARVTDTLCEASGPPFVISLFAILKDLVSFDQVTPASFLNKSVWVTDMACMPRFHFLVFATTARDLQFYNTSASRFERMSRITGLVACPTTLLFHESRWSVAKLLWGDQVRSWEAA